MNKKLILRHKINENPYGLYNSQLEPMSREETIEFFNEIDLTDEELLSLNDYILEDAGIASSIMHTWYGTNVVSP